MLINGKEIAQTIKDEMRVQVASLVARYGRSPHLVVIIVGDDPASRSYIRGKIKAAQYCGISGDVIELPEDVAEDVLLTEIRRLNKDAGVDGILVQLPLPKHIDEQKVIETISPDKDVDGFHPQNVGHLWLNRKGTIPCTPQGILTLLDTAGVPLSGKRAVVVGRSNIVGKPTAKMLLDRDCTVTMAHSHTENLAAVCKEADILVVAVGKAGLITADCVKQGAAVIDVGINRTAEGKIVGDVDFEGVKDIAGWITPVPGGVGPMTIAMLLRNTIDCFVRSHTEKA